MEKILLTVLFLIPTILGNFYVTSSITKAYADENSKIKVIPQPDKIIYTPGYFELSKNMNIYVFDGSDEAKNLGVYLSERINEATGFSPSVKVLTHEKPISGSVVLNLNESFKSLGDEGYKLEIVTDKVIISAFKPAGIFYGIQTLRQVMTGFDADNWKISCATIEDKPRYPWRAFMLDCARHFMSIDLLKRYVDLLAYHKINVFHLHLTDDQGWRMEINRYPLLTEVGAWRKYGILVKPGDIRDTNQKDQRHGGFYTKKELKELVAYAQSRYITVVPEIEMPGHSTAAVACYPELSCTGKHLEVDTTVYSKKNLFCPGKEFTYEFLQNVLDEVCEVFQSKYIHIGSDEALKNSDNWKKCPLCQKRMKDENLKDINELQGYFVKRIDAFMQSKGRIIITWDEILEGGISQNAVVESWRGMEGADAASKLNHYVISAPYQYLYFDYSQDEDSTGTEWNGRNTMKRVYSFEPTPDNFTENQVKYVIGAECCLWTEGVFEHQVDSKVFPRLCAFSEVVWSSAENRDFINFTDRMKIHYPRLRSMGISYYEK